MNITISMGVVLEGRSLLLSKNNFAEFYFFHNYCESLLFIMFKSINTYVFNCIKVNFCTVRHLTDPPWPRACGTGEGGGTCGTCPPPPFAHVEKRIETGITKVPPPPPLDLPTSLYLVCMQRKTELLLKPSLYKK